MVDMVLVHKTIKVLLSLGFLVFALASLLLNEVDMLLQEKETSAHRTYDSKIEPMRRLSFGSCNDQNKEQSIWRAILDGEPDAWLWLGDNIYTDTKKQSYPKVFEPASADEKREMYAKMNSVPDYKELKRRVGKSNFVGTWDDHDYGLDDAGKEFPGKVESQQMFWDFMDEPADSKRRQQEGVYTSHVFGPPGKRVKLFILDTRYHRDPISSGGDMLGAAQWAWLERELANSDAQVNIIASSIQFIPNHHATLCPLCYLEQSPFKVESWAHFKSERKRLLDIIKREKVDGVIILSGDVHMGEILEAKPTCMLPYSLHEMTSSGMTHSAAEDFGPVPLLIMGATAPNPFGVFKRAFLNHNFGTVDFHWNETSPKVTLTVRDKAGKAAMRKVVLLNTLTHSFQVEEGVQHSCRDEDSLHWTSRCRFAITVCILILSAVATVVYAACKAFAYWKRSMGWYPKRKKLS
jgi:alkaline phosphatase D